MDADILLQLRQPFDPEHVTWRVVEVADDARHARVRPQITATALQKRLNHVLGTLHWSYSFAPVGSGISCTLTLGTATLGTTTLDTVSRAAVVSMDTPAPVTASERAQDALVHAAEGFGILPPAAIDAQYWVEFDPEQQVILYEPESAPTAPVTPETTDKSAGHQAIDKLMDKLAQQGRGLDAAKVALEYRGYGDNPQMAREFYGKLRELLLQETS
jgi:hypothetical protein